MSTYEADILNEFSEGELLLWYREHGPHKVFEHLKGLIPSLGNLSLRANTDPKGHELIEIIPITEDGARATDWASVKGLGWAEAGITDDNKYFERHGTYLPRRDNPIAEDLLASHNAEHLLTKVEGAMASTEMNPHLERTVHLPLPDISFVNAQKGPKIGSPNQPFRNILY